MAHRGVRAGEPVPRGTSEGTGRPDEHASVLGRAGRGPYLIAHAGAAGLPLPRLGKLQLGKVKDYVYARL